MENWSGRVGRGWTEFVEDVIGMGDEVAGAVVVVEEVAGMG